MIRDGGKPDFFQNPGSGSNPGFEMKNPGFPVPTTYYLKVQFLTVSYPPRTMCNIRLNDFNVINWRNFNLLLQSKFRMIQILKICKKEDTFLVDKYVASRTQNMGWNTLSFQVPKWYWNINLEYIVSWLRKLTFRRIHKSLKVGVHCQLMREAIPQYSTANFKRHWKLKVSKSCIYI